LEVLELLESDFDILFDAEQLLSALVFLKESSPQAFLLHVHKTLFLEVSLAQKGDFFILYRHLLKGPQVYLLLFRLVLV